MRQTQFKEVIILSAELSSNDHATNDFNTHKLINKLRSHMILSNKATGVYKGSKEVSFVTLPKNDRELAYVKSVAFSDFNQESVLYQDKHGDAFLIYSCGKKEAIGQLRKLGTKNVDHLENYTIMNGDIYSTKGF